MRGLGDMTAARLCRTPASGVAELLLARDRPSFRARLRRSPPESHRGFSEDFLATWGWSPPAELSEWLAIESAVGVDEEPPGYWGSEDGQVGLVCFTASPEEAAALPSGEFVRENVEGLLAGLFGIAEHASGDRHLVSLLPHRRDLVVVHRFEHERGEVGPGSSLRSFLLLLTTSEEDPERGAPPGHVGTRVRRRLERVAREADGKLLGPRARLAHLDSRKLYERSRWLTRLVGGREDLRLEKKLAAAPGLAQWRAERELLGRVPVLANYWSLAHYFLGNRSGCAAAVEEGRGAPGLLTRALAEVVGRLAARPESESLGAVGPERLSELRQTARRSARPDQLER